MCRFATLSIACVLASLAVAGPASAGTLTLKADPTELPGPQVVTASVNADAPGTVYFYSVDKAIPCPATRVEANGSSDGRMNRDEDYSGGNSVSVPQGPSTTKFKADYSASGGSIEHSHICGYLFEGGPYPGTQTAVADAPLRSWVEVAGWNFHARLFWDSPTRATYKLYCSAGTSGYSDVDCPLRGHISMRVSAAIRRKLHLESRTIFEDDFKGLVPNGMNQEQNGWRHEERKLNVKLAPRKLPVTLKVTLTSPVTREFKFVGRVFHNAEQGFWLVQAATYDVAGGRGDDA